MGKRWPEPVKKLLEKEGTSITWAELTFNPWEGCQKVGPGCDHCYAEARNIRFTGGTNWGPGAPRRRTSEANWRKPLRWNRIAEANGVRLRVFCASLADVFDNAVDGGWREDLFELIRQTPHLDWMLLTKRPGNIVAMIHRDGAIAGNGTRYLPDHVALGASIVVQSEADRDIDKLVETRAELGARHLFLSMEPLLEDIVLPPSASQIDEILVGGESGRNARSMPLDRPRSLLAQSRRLGIMFHMKQLSEADYPGGVYEKFARFPKDLQVRERGW